MLAASVWASMAEAAHRRIKITDEDIFFSKVGSTSHTLHYANIQQDYDLHDLYALISDVRETMRHKVIELGYIAKEELETTTDHRTEHFAAKPSVPRSEFVVHRVEYRLTEQMARVKQLNRLFEPIEDEVEEFALNNKQEARDFLFNRHRRDTTGWWMQLHPALTEDPTRRVKRVDPVTIVVAIIAATVAASVVTAFTASELAGMKKEEARQAGLLQTGLFTSLEMSNSLTELNRVTEEVLVAIQDYYATMETMEHVALVCDIVDRRIAVITSVLQSAMHGRVSVAAFTETHYARVAMQVERDARDAGLAPVSKYFTDYLQMQTSFISDSRGFTTYTHIPLIDMNTALEIWQHHVLPIPLGDDLYLNIGPSSFTHLAVTADHSAFRAMTLAEFNGCRKVGSFYLCDRGLSVTKAPHESDPLPPHKDDKLCIFALFARQFKLATAVCPTMVGAKEAAMEQVGPRAFASYAANAHRGTMTCKGANNQHGGPETASFTVHGLQRVELPYGCTAATDTHMFSAADDAFSREHGDYTVSYEWPFDPKKLTPGLDTGRFSQLLKETQALGNRTRENVVIPLREAVGVARRRTVGLNQTLDEHHYVTVPVLAGLIAVLAAGLAAAARYLYKYKLAAEAEARRLHAELLETHMALKRLEARIDARVDGNEEQGRPLKRQAVLAQPPPTAPPPPPPQPTIIQVAPHPPPYFATAALNARTEPTTAHTQAAEQLGFRSMRLEEVLPQRGPASIDMQTMMKR